MDYLNVSIDKGKNCGIRWRVEATCKVLTDIQGLFFDIVVVVVACFVSTKLVKVCSARVGAWATATASSSGRSCRLDEMRARPVCERICARMRGDRRQGWSVRHESRSQDTRGTAFIYLPLITVTDSKRMTVVLYRYPLSPLVSLKFTLLKLRCFSVQRQDRHGSLAQASSLFFSQCFFNSASSANTRLAFVCSYASWLHAGQRLGNHLPPHSSFGNRQ